MESLSPFLHSAAARVGQIATRQGRAPILRLSVEGGGCSGFQYILELTEEVKDKDLTFDDHVVTDDISMPFLDGSTIKFKDDLIGSEFVIDNPNAQSGCGCGTSFAV